MQLLWVVEGKSRGGSFKSSTYGWVALDYFLSLMQTGKIKKLCFKAKILKALSMLYDQKSPEVFFPISFKKVDIYNVFVIIYSYVTRNIKK